MAKAPLRYKRLLKEIPKHKYAKDALIASGFSESTANSQTKRVLRSAIKYEAQAMMDNMNNKDTTQSTKQLMADIVGLSKADIMLALRNIATQEKDLGSALKVLAPLVSEFGVMLAKDDDKQSINVPILNISVEKNDNTDNVLHNPQDDQTLLENNGSV